MKSHTPPVIRLKRSNQNQLMCFLGFTICWQYMQYFIRNAPFLHIANIVYLLYAYPARSASKTEQF